VDSKADATKSPSKPRREVAKGDHTSLVACSSKRRRDKAQEAEDHEANVSKQKRKCEAVMSGAVVEASFAKGEWAIRWRE
jgi:hypothetical protein